ncbi:Glycerol-3-phosphate dehydrogenase [NAD(+)], cytoplasmic [Orchesella cincta]|uniref:Glycerol-3-phosphate dehydrogenase [NAD(+)] n=1 Tax=Orchesella cincta TaxID=48709 RepID=A0A1D2N943_ORCCI|nr:Glycerol-3-phosphate dehydrogenase [NAD(+)], cytoplasmic [Orchesella cincta]
MWKVLSSFSHSFPNNRLSQRGGGGSSRSVASDYALSALLLTSSNTCYGSRNIARSFSIHNKARASHTHVHQKRNSSSRLISGDSDSLNSSKLLSRSSRLHSHKQSVHPVICEYLCFHPTSPVANSSSLGNESGGEIKSALKENNFCCDNKSGSCFAGSVLLTRRQYRVLLKEFQQRRYYHHQSRMGDTGKKRVCIVGSGNWGSAIAKIVGDNVVKHSTVFEDTVKMYVFEELVNGRKLTEIINEDHENVKYLPGHKLPANIIAVPDVLGTAKDADILIFVLPHQFIKHTCKPLVGNMKPGAFGLSLIKGFDVAEGGGIELISSIINKALNIPCNVLMGANLAGEIADGNFSETTIGARDPEQGRLLHKLIQTDNFRVVVVRDVETVELCGALKNVVAVGAGFIDGLKLGDNTKAAVIRLGLMEMVRFTQEFFNKDTEISTFLESCGVADLITTCYGGRNRKVSEAFVRTGKPFEELEKEMLNGQRLQGPMTAAEVNFMLKGRGLEDKFPLFTAVHRISINELKPKQLIDAIRNHPEHISSLANAKI